jgi:hypothetical protein
MISPETVADTETDDAVERCPVCRGKWENEAIDHLHCFHARLGSLQAEDKQCSLDDLKCPVCRKTQSQCAKKEYALNPRRLAYKLAISLQTAAADETKDEVESIAMFGAFSADIEIAVKELRLGQKLTLVEKLHLQHHATMGEIERVKQNKADARQALHDRATKQRAAFLSAFEASQQQQENAKCAEEEEARRKKHVQKEQPEATWRRQLQHDEESRAEEAARCKSERPESFRKFKAILQQLASPGNVGQSSEAETTQPTQAFTDAPGSDAFKIYPSTPAPAASRKRKSGGQVYPPPNKTNIATTTQNYTRLGQDLPVPKNNHVVLGHQNKKKSQYFAYCTHCDKWFDWPPKDTTPKLDSPCSCETAANADRQQQQQKRKNAGIGEKSSAPPHRDDYCPGGTRRRMLKDATGYRLERRRRAS